MQDTAVVIPAFNESENLTILVRKIIENIPRGKIFIVDDSSGDERLKLEKIIAPYKDSIRLLSRNEKGGRGSAVLLGFKEALKDKKIKYFFEMDADLAHNPKEINKFLGLSEKFDVIIGSRYKSGSKITKWPLRRLITSRIINIFLNLLFGLKLSDYTNGFRFYNKKAVEFLMTSKLKETGFIALSESVYKLKRAGYKIGEIATSFTDRKYGKSNAGIAEHLRALYGMVRIRLS